MGRAVALKLNTHMQAAELRDQELELKVQISALLSQDKEQKEANMDYAGAVVTDAEIRLHLFRSNCVGKSELAKALAAYYFGSEEAMVCLHMNGNLRLMLSHITSDSDLQSWAWAPPQREEYKGNIRLKKRSGHRSTLEREKILDRWLENERGSPDVWRCLYRILVEPDDRLAQYIASNSNIILEKQDCSVIYSYTGERYEVKEDEMRVLRSFD
uniref:Uncharacterized protein n=1 Tax=Chenopodium quinoa TaxID=63459 RepID=A0A803KRN9_CHEQI